MNKFVIACMMCLAVVSVTSAGYTDPLWNESEDRVYFDCGNWSGVDNHKDTSFGGHYYFYSKHRKNGRYMFTPTNWGYPSDAKLKSVGFGDVAWTCMYINGFDKELNVNGEVYTDDPTKINYKTSYLRYKGWSTVYWNIYKIDHGVTMSSTENLVTAKNKITFYGKHERTGKSDKKRQVVSNPSDSIQYRAWEKPNSIISAELINHSNYMILNVPTPANITGIKIAATSKNVTAIYEKHTHCLKLNISKPFITCDLVEYKYHNFTEIIPFGPDSYLLQYEPDYGINVTLYTPFETIDAVVIVNETDVEPINTDLKCESIWDLLYIAVPISLIIGLVRLI